VLAEVAGDHPGELGIILDDEYHGFAGDPARVPRRALL
jgi:hypothetical protein